jgi:hypothetical protein
MFYVMLAHYKYTTIPVHLGLYLGITLIDQDPGFAMCGCVKDHETVNHLIWHCERFSLKRHQETFAGHNECTT